MARVRTFVAVDVGEAIRDAAVALQQKLGKTFSDVKWVEPENMHVTLLFLGEVDQLEVLEVCRAAGRATAAVEPFALEVEALGAFPNTRRPKTLWAGISSGADELRRLHGLIEAPLLERGAYRREERAYTPHLTLGRINRDDQAGEWGPVIAKHADWNAGEAQVREVLVMGSELRREGPVYTVLSRAKLAAEAE